MRTGISPSYPDTMMFLGLQQHSRAGARTFVLGRHQKALGVCGIGPATIGHTVRCEPLINQAWRVQEVSCVPTTPTTLRQYAYSMCVCTCKLL